MFKQHNLANRPSLRLSTSASTQSPFSAPAQRSSLFTHDEAISIKENFYAVLDSHRPPFGSASIGRKQLNLFNIIAASDTRTQSEDRILEFALDAVRLDKRSGMRPIRNGIIAASALAATSYFGLSAIFSYASFIAASAGQSFLSFIYASAGALGVFCTGVSLGVSKNLFRDSGKIASDAKNRVEQSIIRLGGALNSLASARECRRAHQEV